MRNMAMKDTAVWLSRGLLAHGHWDLRDYFSVGDWVYVRSSKIITSDQFTSRVANVIAVTKYFITVRYSILPSACGSDPRGVWTESFSQLELLELNAFNPWVKRGA